MKAFKNYWENLQKAASAKVGQTLNYKNDRWVIVDLVDGGKYLRICNPETNEEVMVPASYIGR